MSGESGYDNWLVEERALDAALTNAAREALHGVNRGGTASIVPVARTVPAQYVVIGTLQGIAEAVAERLRMQQSDDPYHEAGAD